MPFRILHEDITKMHTDAIVNAANSRLLEGGGVCGAIFAAAGARELQAECDAIGFCETGHAVITKGYRLPARYIIHAVGPVWNGGRSGEKEALASAYTESLKLAASHDLESIAFPLISSGIYGFPKQAAFETAVSAIRAFLENHEMEVDLIVFDREAVQLGAGVSEELRHYLEKRHTDLSHLPEEAALLYDRQCGEDSAGKPYNEAPQMDVSADQKPHPAHHPLFSPLQKRGRTSRERSLDELVNAGAETFSQMLLRLIDEKGMSDVETYKKANMDRKLFSKIRSNPDYAPKKDTVLALAVALRLSRDETLDLLGSAGYTLTGSRKTDVIVRFFIEHGQYDIYRINEALFSYDQPLLGA